MNVPFFSVIVPVYNVEKYIHRCLESVLSQSFLDFEVIIVDDESPDNSIAIINDKFNDKRIKIISKKNGGLSDARNFGLEHAKGKYVWFIDSDDYITEIDALQKIYDVLKYNLNVDIIAFNMEVCFENKNRETYVIENVIENTKVMSSYEYIHEYNVFPYNATLQCYNRLFLLVNKYRFTKGIYFEDIYLNLDIYKNGASIIGVKEVLYTYFKRGGSITTIDSNYLHFLSQIMILNKLNKIHKENLLPSKYIDDRLIFEFNSSKINFKRDYLVHRNQINEILYNIDLPKNKNNLFFELIEMKLFYYKPIHVLKYQLIFRKLKTLEKLISNFLK